MNRRVCLPLQRNMSSGVLNVLLGAGKRFMMLESSSQFYKHVSCTGKALGGAYF